MDNPVHSHITSPESSISCLFNDFWLIITKQARSKSFISELILNRIILLFPFDDKLDLSFIFFLFSDVPPGLEIQIFDFSIDNWHCRIFKVENLNVGLLVFL
jgi:hypothetical protein